MFHTIYTTRKSTYKLNDRQTPQVTPQSATLPCQNTMVILTSWESTVQDQLTPKFPIKHKNKTSVFTQGSQFMLRAALPLARSTYKVCGWMEDQSMGRGGLQMKYVLGGCDCPTTVNLICTSSLFPGYATMKSMSTTPGHQSLKLPLG